MTDGQIISPSVRFEILADYTTGRIVKFGIITNPCSR